MDQKHDCEHTICTAASANASVCQTISEMDWERGIWNAAFNGDKHKVQSLIDKAKNSKELVNALDNSGYTALHYAARNGHVEVCKVLLNYGGDIDAQTRSGKVTPLLKAAAAGKAATVKLLIQSGAKVDAQDVDGKTVLHKAIENNHTELTTILLEACPTLCKIKDSKGTTHSVSDYK
ncbi:hypothetical protein K1T71_002562 [Dendrolimus kikuchii]|uniref:Uncharacterized protein n=1 Tax=Dendrolimus kikuchii TaxID=765133 RepID=A0ACC1DDF1_9NEOP|nr:hypothetical protein K1T71_002562 [Dendrolimus kikuchii]